MKSFKRLAQTVLRRTGLYHRLKISKLYDLYWGLADRRIIDQREAELTFYGGLLQGFQRGDLVYDIGANHGQKSDLFLRLGARVVALEPDESNQKVLEQKFLRYRLRKKPLVVVGKAVSDRVSVEKMWIDEPGSAKNTLSKKWVAALREDERRFGKALTFGQEREVQTTTLEQLFQEHGLPYFIKIDVEGYEPNVLRGLKRPVPYVSFEVNLPEFLAEGLECIDLLAAVDPAGTFNYAADCEQGLALPQWAPAREFRSVLSTCREPSIEIFWKNSQSRD